MIRKSSILALAAAAVVAGAAMTASAAPIVSLSLTVFTADGTTQILPSGDGKIHLAPGTQVQVVVSGSVASPNLLASSRNTAVRNKPLGIQTLTTSLVSVVTGAPAGSAGGAGSGGAVPVNDASSGQAQQASGTSMTDFTPDGIAYGFANLNDLGADGDKDVQGTGFSNTVLTAPSSASTYVKDSYGTAVSPTALVGHLFTINSDVELRTLTSSLNVYRDQGTSSLAADGAMAGLTEGSVAFSVPEPASMSLLGLGALGLAARRRRA